MAQGLSPRASPFHQHGTAVHQQSPSPPAQPQSKRDKRRSMFSDKLADMINTFSKSQPEHYHAHLSAVQCDASLIMRADPYRAAPLPDTAQEIEELTNGARQEICKHRPIAEEAESSFAALKGRFYTNFAQDVNEAAERRDRDLTMLYVSQAGACVETVDADRYIDRTSGSSRGVSSSTAVQSSTGSL